MKYQVKDNQIVRRAIPENYTHEDDSTTLGYNLLSETELKTDGWLEVVDIIPSYDSLTQFVSMVEERILDDKIERIYEVTMISEQPQPTIPFETKVMDTLAFLITELGYPTL